MENIEEFYIGQKFYITYPIAAARWCHDNQLTINEIPAELHSYIKIVNELSPDGQIVEKEVEAKEYVRTFIIAEFLTVQKKKDNVRSERNNCLELYVDPIVSNPLRWNSLSQAEQQLYIDYRQYLLDFTNQEEWWEKRPLNFEDWKKQQ